MGTAENKDTVRRVYEEVVNNHNLDVLGNYFTPDYVNHKNPGGLAGTRQLFLMLFEAFPDVRVSVDSIGAEGDRVWVRITMQGTQHGPFMGMPPTGRTFAATTVNELRLENGKIVEEWGVTDTLSMWQQLGLMPQQTS
jgi:predicted ester cyclase